MSIKKPVGISKPAGLKKPSVKKPATPVKPVADDIKTPPELIYEEEKVIEIPVIVDEVEEVAPELLEKIVEEENDKLEEQDAVEEPIEVEEKPKKKAAKKSSKKKEEKVEVVAEPQEELPNMSLANAMQSMGPLVQTDPEWEEAKQEMQDKLKATTIDADATPSTMKILIAEIDDLLCELRLLRTEKNDEVKAIDSMMEYIRLKNSVGSNAEERKAKGYMALANHKKNPGDTESINLIELKLFFESQLNFFNESIEILKDRKQLLVTFNGMQKIEANL